MKKKKVTKRQHYIPQFYLKNFSLSSGSLHVFPFSSEKSYLNKIKNLGKEDFYFGSDAAAINFDHELGRYEKLQNSLFKRIIKNYQLNIFDEEEKKLLRFFTLFQESRTKTSKKFSQYFANSLNIPESRDIESRAIDEFEKIPRNVGREKGDKYRTTFGWILKAPTLCHESIFDLKATLIINTTDQNFICGDAPVVRFNQLSIFDEPLESLFSPGLELFYPINNEILLFFYDPRAYEMECDFGSILYLDKSTDLDSLNKLQIINALESVYFSDIKQEKNIGIIYQQVQKNLGRYIEEKFGSYEKIKDFMICRNKNLWKTLCWISRYSSYKLDLSFIHKNEGCEKYWQKKYLDSLNKNQSPELIRNPDIAKKVHTYIQQNIENR